MDKGHPPRVRDLPGPRRSESAIGPLFRTVFKWPYRVALAGLYRAGFRPWQLTFLSLATNGLIGWLLVTGRRLVPGLLLMLAGRGQGHRLSAALALSTLIVSMLVSHIRAEAEAEGIALTEGFVQRLERYVLLTIGLTAPGALTLVLALMTALGSMTVIQRGVSAWRQLGRVSEGPTQKE